MQTSTIDSRPALFLHADDFGMNTAVNAGVMRALETGLLTSTSVLANAPAAAAALAAWSRLDGVHRSSALPARPTRLRIAGGRADCDLGVHLNLTQGRPLTPDFPSALLDRRGCFPGIFGLFAKLGHLPPGTALGTRARRTAEAIAAELRAQIEFVTSHGIAPTHFNGHQYIELIPVVGEIVIALAREYGVATIRVAREPQILRYARPGVGGPLQAFLGFVKRRFARQFARAVAAAGLTAPAAFFGTLHAGRISRSLLENYLTCGRAYSSVEIAVHPAELAESVDVPMEWVDPLATLRPTELAWLCDPATAERITAAGYELGRLADLATPVPHRDLTRRAA